MIRPALRRACVLAAQLGTSVWLTDAILTLVGGTPVTPSRATGWAAALGLTVLVLTLAFLALEVTGISPTLVERARELRAARDATVERGRIAASCALALLTIVLAPVAFAATQVAIIGIARPHFAATVIVALHAALAVVLALVWPRARALTLVAVEWLARTRLEPVVRTSARFFTLWLTLVGVGGVALAGVFFETVRLLPWHPVASVVVGVALTVLASVLMPRVERRVVAIAARSLLAAAVLGGLAAMIAMSYAPDAARAALRESLGGNLGHRLAALALDFDHDGALSVLGGGDCAPFDAKRFPGAIDIPDNRLDEDCDGKDLTRGNILARQRHDWPLPDDFPRKPAVVLITVDAFAARHMHALNPDKNARANTPALDALAKQGTLFTHCFSQGPSTRLSFPSIFTSRWDSQIEQRLVRMHPFPLESSETTLAEVMKEAGYETTAVVSDSYFTRGRWSSLLQGFMNVAETPVRTLDATKHNSVSVTDEAVKRLARKSGKPLFLWAHYFDAHPPHVQPADIPAFGKTQADRYDAELQLVDREIGRLLKEIDKQLGQDAIVIVTGDHGIGFDAPRHRRLSYGYDLTTVVLHVPLIVRGPEVKAQVLPGLVSTMDIAPTIANLVRVRKKLPFEGASLAPELFTSVAQRPARLHHQFYLHERLWNNEDPLSMVSVRTERYNLILDRNTGVHELYDYDTDYLEAHDLAGDPAYADVLTTLKQQLALFTYELHAPHRTAAAQLH